MYDRRAVDQDFQNHGAALPWLISDGPKIMEEERHFPNQYRRIPAFSYSMIPVERPTSVFAVAVVPTRPHANRAPQATS